MGALLSGILMPPFHPVRRPGNTPLERTRRFIICCSAARDCCNALLGRFFPKLGPWATTALFYRPLCRADQCKRNGCYRRRRHRTNCGRYRDRRQERKKLATQISAILIADIMMLERGAALKPAR